MLIMLHLARHLQDIDLGGGIRKLGRPQATTLVLFGHPPGYRWRGCSGLAAAISTYRTALGWRRSSQKAPMAGSIIAKVLGSGTDDVPLTAVGSLIFTPKKVELLSE